MPLIDAMRYDGRLLDPHDKASSSKLNLVTLEG